MVFFTLLVDYFPSNPSHDLIFAAHCKAKISSPNSSLNHISYVRHKESASMESSDSSSDDEMDLNYKSGLHYSFLLFYLRIFFLYLTLNINFDRESAKYLAKTGKSNNGAIETLRDWGALKLSLFISVIIEAPHQLLIAFLHHVDWVARPFEFIKLRWMKMRKFPGITLVLIW